MPKPSSLIKDAIELGFGIQDGNWEVTEAAVTVHQYPPNKETGVQGDPFPCVRWGCVRLDENGERLDDEPTYHEFGIGKLDYFHPGQADNRDDAEPEDLGSEVGTLGNSIWCDGKALAKSCNWIRMSDSLQKAGFKPDILGASYMPDFVGLKGKFKTITLPRYPGMPADRKDPTALVVEKVLAFPYDRKGKGKQEAKGKTGAASAASKSKPADSDDSTEKAVEVLQQVAASNSGKEMTRSDVLKKATIQMLRASLPAKVQKQIAEMLKDDDRIEALAAAAGVEYDSGEGKFSF